MTQIYQVAEDSRRGDHTLMIRLGVGRSLLLALLAALSAHACFLTASWPWDDPRSTSRLPWWPGWRSSSLDAGLAELDGPPA